MREGPEAPMAHGEFSHNLQNSACRQATLASMSDAAPGPDPIYKRLYAFPAMVEDLLHSLVQEEWIGGVDFQTLQKLPSDYVGDDFRQRYGDAAWRVRLREEEKWLHILVLLEFQSRNDPEMALRILEYTTLLYRELRRNKTLELGGLLPPTLPVVVYNGEPPWVAATNIRELIAPTGPALAALQPSQRFLVLDERHTAADSPHLGELTRAVVRLEQSRSEADFKLVVDALLKRLATSNEGGLKRAFADWIRVLSSGLQPTGEEPMANLSLEDLAMTLEERVKQWPQQWLRKGREQGLREGLEQGLEQGLARGFRHERALLHRQASSKFDAETVGRLAAALEEMSDPERLAEVGEAIVRCETGSELLRRLDAV